MSRDDRAALVLAFQASVPPDYQNLIINSNTIPIFVETGMWSLAAEELQVQKDRTNAMRVATRQDIMEADMKLSQDQASFSTEGERFVDIWDKHAFNPIEEGGGAITDTNMLALPITAFNDEKMRLMGAAERARAGQELPPEFWNDYGRFSNRLMGMLKETIKEELTPFWFGWFRSAPAPAIFDIAPDIVIQDKQRNPITDPSKAGDAYWIYHPDTGEEMGLGVLNYKFGKIAIEALLEMQLIEGTQ